MAGDAFQAARAMSAAAAGRDNGIAIQLPAIPLWLPDGPRQAINGLVLDTTRLALQDAAGFISDEAGRYSDTGALAQSFGSDPATAAGGIEVVGTDATAGINGRVFSTLPYAIVMDQGRRPGQPISRAGIDAIGLWAQRKLGMSADEAAKAKWAIAVSIMAQGFPGTGYFEDGVNRARPRVEQLFSILAEQITAALVQQRGRGTGTA